ncbi:MAG: cytosine permease, partial [Xanthomonadales bacterium]|nr:cytosine permease [Xanthomonadales bacterium]
MSPNERAPDLANPDLLPVPDAQRHWTWLSIASLWVGMVVCVPSYMLAAGLVAEGMSLGQAVTTIFLGNLIVLLPMLLIGHAGT